MTAFVLLFAPAFTALFGVLFAAILALQPPGLPLSVRVPQAHANDAVIHRAVRRFGWGLAVAWVLTAGVTVVLATDSVTPLATVVPVLLYAVGSVLVLVLSRRMILRAKREGEWFTGLSVRVSAQISQPAHHHPPILWPALALAVLAVAAAINVALYPTLPDPLPVHFTLGGQPDGWAAKSVASVFGILLLGGAIVLLLTALPSQLAFVIALGLSGIELAQRLLPGVAVGASAIGMVVLVMVVIITTVIRARVQLRPANARKAGNPRPDAVDDDKYWKGGLFYVNPHDPTIVVPRRLGLGWTFDLGRPGGIALTILLLLAIAAAVTAPIFMARGR